MNKIFSFTTLCLAMVFATLVSCSDDEKINTGSATVSFTESNISVKESKGLFYVPISVTGEQNGPIKLTVSVSSNDADCKEDVNYLITSKDIIIPADKKQVSVEIKAVDDRKINDDRHFSLHIENVSGATVGSTNATANITLLDNDDIPYERIAGTWVATAKNTYSETGEEPITWEINLSVIDDDTDPQYGSYVYTTPWAIWDGSTPIIDEEGGMLSHEMTFRHDAATDEYYLEMRLGTVMASNLDFGTQEGVDLSNGTAKSATMGMTGPTFVGTAIGRINKTFDEIAFNKEILILITFPTTAGYMPWGGFQDLTLKLKK